MISGIKDAVRDSLLLKGFIGIMALSFGVWGVGDFIGTGGLDPSIAVQVGNTEITTFEFQRRFDQELARFREEVGTEAARNDALKRSIANAMIQDIAQTATVSAAAQELGIVIPLQRLQSGLLKEAAFQNSVGTFDQIRFLEVLAQNNLTEPQFLDMFASDLRRATIISPVIANASAPEYLVENLFAYRNETRVADTLLVTSPSLTEEDLPSDEELEALYEQNITAYTAPEYRKITTLILEAKHFHSAGDISDADIRARYDENPDRYRTSGTRRISQLIFDTQEQATSVRSQLAPGEDLAALAAKANVPAPIEMGDLSANSAIANMMGDAYEIPLKEISQPIETDLGWHLFYVSAETLVATIPFEDVQDEIRQSMIEEGGIDAVYEASVELEDGIAGGTPLKEISEYVGGEIIEILEMDRNGLDRQGVDVPEIFDRLNFINAAFSYPEGEASQLLDTPARTGYYVVQVDAVTPPAPRPLEEVRARVVTLWEKQTRTAKAEALVAELQSGIGPSSKFSDIATSHATVSYAPLGPITRFGEGLDAGHIVDSKRISPALLKKLFSAKPGTVLSAPVAEGFVVARLNQVNIPKPEGNLAGAQLQLKTTTINAMRDDLADQIVNAFIARYPIEVNNEVVDQTIALR